MEVELITIILSEPLAKILFPIFMTLSFVGPEVLAPKEGTSTRRHNNDSIYLEVKIATQPFWATHASKSTGKEGCYCTCWND